MVVNKKYANEEIDKECKLEKVQLVVVGGGAAGMIAAGIAAERYDRVILCEQNPKLGKKIYITGKGRCNITNLTIVDELIKNTIVNGKFLINAYFKFNSEDTVSFFNDLGLKTKIERGNRVFPCSDKSSDVIKYLERFLQKKNVSIIQNKIIGITRTGKDFKIMYDRGEYLAERVLLATGGRSYPATGSEGDGYRFARDLGHTIIPQKPSLVPIETNSSWKMQVTGLKLRNVSVRIIENKKVMYKDFGEFEFTDFGITGPVVLSASSFLRDIRDHVLILDLKPALNENQLDKRLIREFEKDSHGKIKDTMKKVVPIKLIPVILTLSNIDPIKKCSEINKNERKKIVNYLKNLEMKLLKFRPFDEAIITSGGISVKEIDPMTMESKLHKGLFFAGEIIDVDALTGGYNLQIAWSTGYTAGSSC